MINLKRIRNINKINFSPGNILYWMQRDQRVDDNWALIYAYHLAKKYNKRLYILFNVVDNFLNAPLRHYHFMFEGLKEVDKKCKQLNINFVITYGNPVDNITNFIKNFEIQALITDFNPIKIVDKWINKLKEELNIPILQVDAHNIVPAFYVSDKQEFAAYTLRPKIHKLLNEFLDDYPKLEPLNQDNIDKSIKTNQFILPSNLDNSVKIVELNAGYDTAILKLNDFISNKLKKYNERKNDPNLNYNSGLSAYLHFGHISSQTVVLSIIKNINKLDFKLEELYNSFFDEIIVRKELSDNFCLYNKNYDNFDGFPNWAKETLNAHRNDKREYLYSLDELENSLTHDDLWNAAQRQMVREGFMHGYLRMYWAKKILEWTENPELALEYAIYLNDKYELDGRDPNGYTGIAWSIGGVHDRHWFERHIFGKIRYMNFNGCAKKFNTKDFINKYK